MIEHPLPLVIAALAAVVAAIATRIEVLPEVIDLSSVPTSAGFLGLLAAGYGAARRFPPDRLAQVTLFGNLAGAAGALLIVAIGLAIEVL